MINVSKVLDAVENFLSFRSPPIPAYPKGRVAVLSEYDDDIEEEPLSVLLEDAPICFFMVYEDAKGNVSERNVTIRNIKKGANNSLLMRGYCHERRALRSFRLDRVKEMVFPITGEVLSSVDEFMDFLCIEKKQDKNTYGAIEKCKHGLNILVFIARCDGRYDSEEEDVLVHYLMNECFDYNLDEDVLKQYFQTICPDVYTFRSSVKALALGEGFENIFKYAVRLAEADGVLLPIESDLLRELEDFKHAS